MLRIFVLLSRFLGAIAASHPDEVKSLPGLNFTLNYKHYSGYLHATTGRYLHYWFVESQRSPSTDPVVLWLNGGPGCSSLDGFLSELGPLHVSADGNSVYNNPYAWNKVANVIFLESPAGVGFSYSDNQKYSATDDSVSKDNYVALQNFYQKFPEFAKNDFYISGESYGGVYVPTLSVRILTGPAKINLKGFSIGNGYLNVKNLASSIVFFAYYHGLLSTKLWNSLTKNCCGGVGSRQTCNFVTNISDDCHDAVSQVTHIVDVSGLNVYNLYSDCAQPVKNNSRYSVDKRNILSRLPKLVNGTRTKHLTTCLDESHVAKWINQPSVRQALNIPTHVQDWDICSPDVEDGYKRIYDTMGPQILHLIGSGKIRGLIYNGDVDMACNFLGDEWFADDLGLTVTKEYNEWIYNNQIAGFYKKYGPLTFLTVKGAGHMVPEDKPGPALKMITNFLSNSPYD